MTKPVGYYTNYTPGDEGLLAEMQETFGSQFEALNNSQRFWMIMSLAEIFSDENDVKNEHDEDVQNSIERFEELTESDRIGLMEALVAQARHFGRY